jgi:hypothetical protein
MDQPVESSIEGRVVGEPESFAVPTPAPSKSVGGARDLVPRDEWERKLLAQARDYGISLSDEAVSSEGIY